MVIKQLRVSRHLAQGQLSEMSRLNVRSIQRIESGHNASLESLKCLASVLEVDVDTLQQTRLDMKTQEELWQAAPLWVRCWFALNYLNLTPSKRATVRALFTCHISGYVFCILGLISQPALAGGIIMLGVGYFFNFCL
ncbi:transcriptional regulator [Pseudoalteromonas phenolica]|uniref:helix-turn-helix domain-containing protein n=1 Tax=Pseudoalteromonas phenolica TaxID=161398 RepID=UPI00110A8505|nr:helix-turn-helix transcriptional regulator [Pseudoalteromonas phenolica]TMN91829.1 transcriptional regulator [Pseudoalteromonas phenolica]